jgi:hypothetical protein
MLFYETEGKFGEEGFKVTAKSLFLLDIGTQSYTEYDPADPELIKFMMANPETLMLKKGHIHSHNNMAVFFSGTDDDELVDNSGFHNFYLSLIVNNKNDMCAKIAFKAKTETETNVTLTFLDEKGKEKKKNLTSKKEEQSIYVYKCNIIKSVESVEDSFESRFQELKGIKDRKIVEAANLREKATKGSSDFNERWKQPLLFEGLGWSSGVPKKKEEKTSVVERSSRVDPKIYSMLSKLIALDPLYEGTLGGLLKKLDTDFYPLTDYSGDRVHGSSPSAYYDAIMTKAVDFYIDAFPEDTIKLTDFEATMQKCISLLETYEDQFPELVANLTETINLELK